MEILTWLRAQADRVAAIAAIVLGLILVLLGWRGASETAYATEQIPYLVSGAVAGLFLMGLGATIWLSADLRDEWRKLDRLERVLNEGSRRPKSAEPRPDVGAGDTQVDRPSNGRRGEVVAK